MLFWDVYSASATTGAPPPRSSSAAVTRRLSQRGVAALRRETARPGAVSILIISKIKNGITWCPANGERLLIWLGR